MNNSLLLLLPILLPILSGLLLGLYRPLREPRAMRSFLLAALSVNAAAVFALLLLPDMSLELFRLTDRLPILFHTDDLARLFCIIASIMFLLAGIYSPEYMRHEGNERRFYSFYLIVLGMLMGLGLSGNLMTLYLFFEAMTLSSMPLVLHSLKKEAVAASFKYLYYSLAGASLALIGLFFLYIYGTTLNFTPGGVLDMAKLAGHEGQMLTVTLLTVIGFGAKAGMFPLHSWLSAAHPIAPAPASAVLSGVITKAGVLAVIRFVYFLVGPGFLRGTWVQTVWISLALFTVAMGSVLAFREQELKRRLAYSSISQVSYILLGLALLSPNGLLGGLLHLVVHSTAKTALFLIAGTIILKSGRTHVDDMRGLGKQMPVTIWSFTLLALTIIGIPPTSGFLSKWYLATASLEGGADFLSWLGPVILILSALFSAAYLLPVSINGFFPGAEYSDNTRIQEPPRAMLLPVLFLALAAVLFGIFPAPLISFLEGIVGGVL